MKRLESLLAVLALSWSAGSSFAQNAGAWLGLADDSDAVVLARVIEPERFVHRPERRTERVSHFPDGSVRVQFAPRDDYWVGNVATLRVEHVYKTQGRPVAVDQVIQVFVDRRTHLVQGSQYVLFLRPEVEDFPSEPEAFRGTTLVSDLGPPVVEVPFVARGVFGRTITAFVDPRVSPVVTMDDKTGEQLQQLELGIQQSLDRVRPAATLARAPRPVIRGTEVLAVDAQDDVGISDVKLYAENMEPGGIMTGAGLAMEPPYSVSWDTTHKPDGHYRIWVVASDLRGNKSANPPIDVVVDNTAPTLAITASPSAIWPPSGSPVPVTVAVEAADRIDATPHVKLISIVANDPNPLAGVGGASFGEDDRQFTLAAVAGREYLITYEAEDAAGNTVQASTRAAVNRIPTVSVSAAAPGCHPRPGIPCPIDVIASASDPDGDALSYGWQGCAGGSAAAASCAVTSIAQHTARVTVTDTKGASASAEVVVSGTNSAPVVSASAGRNSACHPVCTKTISATATDVDGDPLTYAWSGCASGNGSAASCTITSLATFTASVAVSDGWESASASASCQGTNVAPQLTPQGCPKVVGHGQEVTITWSIADDDTSHLCDAAAPAPESLQILSSDCYSATVRSRDCTAEGLPDGCYGVVYMAARDPWGANSPAPPGCIVESRR